RRTGDSPAAATARRCSGVRVVIAVPAVSPIPGFRPRKPRGVSRGGGSDLRLQSVGSSSPNRKPAGTTGPTQLHHLHRHRTYVVEKNAKASLDQLSVGPAVPAVLAEPEAGRHSRPYTTRTPPKASLDQLSVGPA